MRKVLFSVVLALALAGGLVAAMSGVISASPALANPVVLTGR